MGIMKGRRNKLMLLMFLVMALIKPIYVNAGSLDSLIEERENEVVAEQETEEQTQPLQEQEDTGDTVSSDLPVSSDEFVGGLKEASDLSTPDTRANAVNSALRSAASLTVQVLALAITVFIVVRIMLDLLYIAIPMTRGALSRGATAQGGARPSIGSGVPGGKGGMPSRYSGGMSGSMGQQQSAGSSIVSNSAIMAVASESTPGPDGKVKGSYSTYLRAIAKELVIVPVIIVLVATGTLQSLGYLMADVLVKLIGSIGNMI